MKNDPLKITYNEPQLPGQRIRSIDDVQSALPQLGFNTKTFAGSVNSDGTPGELFPKGWTITYPTGGDASKYTINHGINTTRYSVVMTIVRNLSGYLGHVLEKNAGSFVILTENNLGTGVALPFDFVMTVQI